MKKYIQSSLIAKSNLIYVDTSFLMCEEFEEFLKRYGNQLVQEEKKLIVIKEVRMELMRIMNCDDLEKSDKAMRAYNIMVENKELIDIDLTPVLNEDVETAFADVHLISKAATMRINNQIMILTKDRRLKEDLKFVNVLGSCKGKEVIPASLNTNGKLDKYHYKKVEQSELLDVQIEMKQAEKECLNLEIQNLVKQKQEIEVMIHDEDLYKTTNDSVMSQQNEKEFSIFEQIMIGLGYAGIGGFTYYCGKKYLLKIIKALA